MRRIKWNPIPPTHSPGPDSYIGRKRTEKINISIRHLIKIKLKNSVISQEFKYVWVGLFLQERWQKDGRMLTVRDKTWNVKKGHVFQPVGISRKLSIYKKKSKLSHSMKQNEQDGAGSKTPDSVEEWDEEWNIREVEWREVQRDVTWTVYLSMELNLTQTSIEHIVVVSQNVESLFFFSFDKF